MVRKAIYSDIDTVLKIYEKARQYMADTGNPKQWSDSYPPKELVMRDIEGGNLFVLEDSADIYGVFAFFPEGDSIYDDIEGEWLNSLPHAAIHRVASAGTRRGVLAECIDFCLSQSNNLKIDTYTTNKIMQHQLLKYGFVNCGTLKGDMKDFPVFQLYKDLSI